MWKYSIKSCYNEAYFWRREFLFFKLNRLFQKKGRPGGVLNVMKGEVRWSRLLETRVGAWVGKQIGEKRHFSSERAAADGKGKEGIIESEKETNRN